MNFDYQRKCISAFGLQSGGMAVLVGILGDGSGAEIYPNCRLDRMTLRVIPDDRRLAGGVEGFFCTLKNRDNISD